MDASSAAARDDVWHLHGQAVGTDAAAFAGTGRSPAQGQPYLDQKAVAQLSPPTWMVA